MSNLVGVALFLGGLATGVAGMTIYARWRELRGMREFMRRWR